MGVTTLDVLSLPFSCRTTIRPTGFHVRRRRHDAGRASGDRRHRTGAGSDHSEPPAIYGDEPLRTIEQLDTGIRVFPHEQPVVGPCSRRFGGHAAYDLNGDDWAQRDQQRRGLAAEYPIALAPAHGL